MKIYMAGPLFTLGERMFNAELASRLRAAGYEVFLPQEIEQRDATSKTIFYVDVVGIDWCDVVLGCMDGPDPDSGTCWECGSVFRQKPVVLYRTDIRQEAPPFGPYNLMLTQSAERVLDLQWKDIDTVAALIGAVLEALP
jgi:nucleoside 2-deoxyribosyltransferase